MASAPITIHGLDEVFKSLNGLSADLRKPANGELRQAARQIANDALPLLGGSGAPQDAALKASLGAKSDRLVTIAVVRKPKLSGLRKTPAATAKGIVLWPVELGSGAPQFHHPSAGAFVERRKPAVARMAIPRYQAAVTAILRKYGLL